MAAFSTIFAGVSAASAAGGGLFSVFHRRSNDNVSQLVTQENAIRQVQMNLEATRRTRDVIRNAQTATANSEAAAYSQGAGNSSSLEGVRGSIAGTAGTNIQGIEQNRALSDIMFGLNKARGQALQDNSASQSRAYGMQTLLGTLAKSGGTLGKLADYGWGSMAKMFGGNNWDNQWDINQVGQA